MAKKLVPKIFPLKFMTNTNNPTLIKTCKTQAEWDRYISSIKNYTEEDFLNSHGMPSTKTFYLGSRGPGGCPLKDYLQK